MYYKITINQTSKPLFSKQPYQQFNKLTPTFQTLDEVKEYLKENYPKCKREKMYIDKKDNTQEHIGYIYCFKNKDYCHNLEQWLQQDWCTITEVQEKTILI